MSPFWSRATEEHVAVTRRPKVSLIVLDTVLVVTWLAFMAFSYWLLSR